MHLSSNEANIDKISLFISHIHRKWMREQERKAETVARSYGILLESNERCVRNTENGERARARKKKSSSREHYHFYNVLIYVDAQKKKKTILWPIRDAIGAHNRCSTNGNLFKN